MKKYKILNIFFILFLFYNSCVGISIDEMELSQTINRVNYSKDGNTLLLSAFNSIFEIEIESGNKNLIGGGKLFAAAYSENDKYIIATYIKDEDKDIIAKQFSKYNYRDIYSGFVIFENGIEIKRVEVNGFCAFPVISEKNNRIYYTKTILSKNKLQNIKTIALWDIYGCDFDGKNEMRLTEHEKPVFYDLNYSSTRNELYYITVANNLSSWNLYKIELISNSVAIFNNKYTNFKYGELSIGIERTSDRIGIIQRFLRKDASKDDHLLTLINANGNKSIIGNIQYNTMWETGHIINIIFNEQKQKVIYFQKEYFQSDIFHPKTKIYTANYDGSVFNQISIPIRK